MRFVRSLLTQVFDYGRYRRMRQPVSRALAHFVGRCLPIGAVGFLLIIPGLATAQNFKSTYPRIGAIEIGSWREALDPEYRQVLAQHDIMILGYWRDWRGNDVVTNEVLTLRDVVVDIKQRAAAMGNSEILVGKYTVYNESGSNPDAVASRDKWDKLHNEVGPGYRINNDWWARNSDGENTSSWRGSWNTNVTEYVTRDSNGDYWPEWAANRDYELYFRDIPELDIWFIDNWFYRPRVDADWDGDGINDDPKSESLGRAFRHGHMNAVRRIRQLAPNIIVMGNAGGGDPYNNKGMMTDPEYKGQLTALYQAAIGKSHSTETWGTWEAMMKQYQTTLSNAQHRVLLMSVNGEATDYATMRYGLTSCLLDDGYYYYTTHEKENRSGLWFDEYDVDLGLAIDPPQFEPWQNGVYKRRFQYGIALVNPKGNGRKTIQVEPGYRRILGTQDSLTNNGQAVNSITLAERDGIILIRDEIPDEKPRPKAPVLSATTD